MIEKLYKSFIYSVNGLLAAYQKEPSIKIEYFLLPIMIGVAVTFAPDKTSMLLMIASLFIVLIAELLNSGIEKTCDLISKDHHPLIEYAKDVGSAAVFLANVLVVIVYVVTFLF